MREPDANGRRHLMQVVYSLFPAGSERLAHDIALGLDSSRVRSSICALALGGPLAQAFEEAAIPCYLMQCEPGRQWHLIPRLYRLFRDSGVDIVQTHHLKQLLYSAVGARLAGAALVHVEHDYFSLRPPRIRRRLRLAASLCHRIVVVGEEVRAFLVDEVRLPPSKITVIPNGVDIARYTTWPRVAREALGLNATGRLIGHVARLEPEKDQRTLLCAFRLVADVYPDTRLVVVGDGSQRGELQRVAGVLGLGHHVDFLGFREDVADLLPHFELFVLSSSGEGLPLAILEAMASGRPVVSTAVGEIPHVVRDGATGLTVRPGDPPALADAITAVLERPEWGQAMGAAARQAIEARHSLTRVIGQYQALYDSLPFDDSRGTIPGGKGLMHGRTP